MSCARSATENTSQTSLSHISARRRTSISSSRPRSVRCNSLNRRSVVDDLRSTKPRFASLSNRGTTEDLSSLITEASFDCVIPSLLWSTSSTEKIAGETFISPKPDEPEPKRRLSNLRQHKQLGCASKLGRSADSRPLFLFLRMQVELIEPLRVQAIEAISC